MIPFIKTDRYEEPQRPSSEKLHLRSFYNTPIISELMQEKLDKSVQHLRKKIHKNLKVSNYL